MAARKSPAKKPAGKTVAIVYRLHTDKAVRCAKELAKWLKTEGHRALTAPAQEPLPGAPLMKSADEFDDIDLVVVLGGDGTYLRAVRALEGRQVPILGFNMGSLGFLTVHAAREWRSLVRRALAGGLLRLPRTMILAEVRRGTRSRGEFHALNDIVLERGNYSHLINSGIYLGRQRVADVKADAIIVSSPTGSTAYNLAAGGPILDPAVRAFIVTPVAAHALTTRPFVVPDDVEIRLKLAAGREQKAHFIVDGQKQMELSVEDEVVIRKSAFDHLILRRPGFNSFWLLKEKLKFGDRA